MHLTHHSHPKISFKTFPALIEISIPGNPGKSNFNLILFSSFSHSKTNPTQTKDTLASTYLPS